MLYNSCIWVSFALTDSCSHNLRVTTQQVILSLLLYDLWIFHFKRRIIYLQAEATTYPSEVKYVCYKITTRMWFIKFLNKKKSSRIPNTMRDLKKLFLLLESVKDFSNEWLYMYPSAATLPNSHYSFPVCKKLRICRTEIIDIFSYLSRQFAQYLYS